MFREELASYACLGPEGNLDIWNVYMPASDTQLRQKCLLSLAKNVQSADKTLSILVGDWNFTMHVHDRIAKKDATWTGDSQSKEAGIFIKQILTPYDFCEIFQPLHTHEDGMVRSRLDRVYINHHPTDFLDKDIRAWVHNFPYEISHHRTLLFCRKRKPVRTKVPGVSSPLPLAGINHPDFRSKVEKAWQDKREHLVSLTPLQQLGEFKKEMRRAAFELAGKGGSCQPTLHEDRLNACMRLIRAMEANSRVLCDRILSTNTELATLAAGRTKKPLLAALRNLAWELFQKNTQDLIDELKVVKGKLTEEENSRRKDTILRRLQLSLPLNREVKLVIQSQQGNIETEPYAMALALRDHWKKVFTARPTSDRTTLRKWLTEHPYGVPPTLRKSPSVWLLTQQQVELAIKHSNNSSPGPDGIPYAAWRNIGHLVVAVLHEAALQMQEEDFNIDELPDGFNMSCLCCLPKKPTGTDPTAGDFFCALLYQAALLSQH